MWADALGIKRGVVESTYCPDGEGGHVVPLSDDALAVAFALQFKDILVYDCNRGRWYLWNGFSWREEITGLPIDWARKLCRALNLPKKSKWQSYTTARNIVNFGCSDRAFARSGDQFNRDPFLLATPAGTVDLRTGALREATPADYITKCTLVGPEPGEPGVWLQFLDQTTRGDKELMRFLKQIAGYALSGDCREECLFFFYGPGGNGKTTFINTLQTVLGDYARAAAMDTFHRTHGERHSTDIAMLKDARFVTSAETQGEREWDEERIKSMSGRELLTARFMRQDNFQFPAQFKLL
jgi:putative DNA primase/helicase